MLNILKEMKGPTPIHFWGPSSNKLPRRLPYVHQVNKLFENLAN